MTNTDFKTKWVRRTSKARAKAPDANDVLRGGGPGALRGKLDEARVVSLAGLRPDAHHACEDEANGDTVAAVINASNEQNGRHHSPVWWQDVITADRLQHEVYEPIRFVVPDLIPAERVTLLCSKPKIGKSWLVLDLCIGCTTDRFILGQIKPVQGDVLYLALEDSRRRLQRRMTKLLPTFNGCWPNGLMLATTWRRVSEGGLDDIRAWHKSVESPILVAVDVLVKVRPVSKGGRSAYELDYEALAGLHKLAIELGVAIIVVHRTRKMAAEDVMDTVSGSFGLVGAADTIVVIERRGQGAVLDVRSRDVESAELAIQEPLTPKEIMVATGRSDRNAVDQLLFRMVQANDIAKVARGKYALPSKIDKKESSDQQPTDITAETGNLTNLTHLTEDSETLRTGGRYGFCAGPAASVSVPERMATTAPSAQGVKESGGQPHGPKHCDTPG